LGCRAKSGVNSSLVNTTWITILISNCFWMQLRFESETNWKHIRISKGDEFQSDLSLMKTAGNKPRWLPALNKGSRLTTNNYMTECVHKIDCEGLINLRFLLLRPYPIYSFTNISTDFFVALFSSLHFAFYRFFNTYSWKNQCSF